MSSQISPKSKLPEKWICIHEGGHAVAAAIAATRVPGWRLVEVVANHEGGCAFIDPGPELAATHWRLITGLAGPKAEELIAGRSCMIAGWDDMTRVFEIATQMNESEPDDVVDRYSAIAARFVRRHRERIIRVAATLQRRGRLSGAQVAAIVSTTSRARSCRKRRSRRSRARR